MVFLMVTKFVTHYDMTLCFPVAASDVMSEKISSSHSPSHSSDASHVTECVCSHSQTTNKDMFINKFIHLSVCFSFYYKTEGVEGSLEHEMSIRVGTGPEFC